MPAVRHIAVKQASSQPFVLIIYKLIKERQGKVQLSMLLSRHQPFKSNAACTVKCCCL